jgi:hypothetical protein
MGIALRTPDLLSNDNCSAFDRNVRSPKCLDRSAAAAVRGTYVHEEDLILVELDFAAELGFELDSFARIELALEYG